MSETSKSIEDSCWQDVVDVDWPAVRPLTEEDAAVMRIGVRRPWSADAFEARRKRVLQTQLS